LAHELGPPAPPPEAEEAQVVEEAGDLDGAEAGYREALEKEPGNHDASIGLARILLARGEDEAALALAEPLLPDPEAEHIVAQVRVRGWGQLTPSDPLEQAKVAAAQGRPQEALDAMLSVFDSDPDAARQAMVDVFTALGPEDPVVVAYRPKLAARLF
jgi:putative thioredoxin